MFGESKSLKDRKKLLIQLQILEVANKLLI